MKRFHFICGVVFFLLSVPASWAAIIEVFPGDPLQSVVDALNPGDVMVMNGGVYTLSSRFSIQVTGTPSSPVEIRAQEGETPVITYISAAQNVINVENSSHLRLLGLEVTGGSQGIRLTNSSFITIESCHIHDTEDVALSANVAGSSYEGLRLLRNHIHHTGGTGEGMYLGCNNDGCRIFDSLIEGNYIHHTDSIGVSQGDGIELKEGSYNNVIRDNVIHNTGFPCIITYSTVGNGGANVVERNLMWACGDHAVQSAADAIIRNNIILGAVVDGIRCQPHQAGTPANLTIAHNTVLAPSNNAIRVSGITGVVNIVNNALYAQSGNAIQVDGVLTDLVVDGNAGSGGLQGTGSGFNSSGLISGDMVSASYSGTLPQDVFPAPGSVLVGAASSPWMALDDFNASPRDGDADIGGYRFHPGGNSGWTLDADFKVFTMFSNGFESGDTLGWSSVVP